MNFTNLTPFLIFLITFSQLDAVGQIPFDLEKNNAFGGSLNSSIEFFLGHTPHQHKLTKLEYVQLGGEHARFANPGETDPYGHPLTSPITKSQSIVLGNGKTAGSQGAISRWKFVSPKGQIGIVLHVYVVAEDPNHDADKQNPSFSYKLRINGKQVKCGSYEMNKASQAFDHINVPPKSLEGLAKKGLREIKKKSRINRVYYLDWSTLLIPIEHKGSEVELDVQITDCAKSGHFGYTAWDAQLVNLEMEKEGALSCNSIDQVTLTAPYGASAYKWSNGSTSREIKVSLPGDYHVELTLPSGCPLSLSQTVEAPKQRVRIGSIEKTGVLSCDSLSPVFLTAPENALGYLWSTGDTTRTISAFDPDEYFVELIGPKGLEECIDTFSLIVPIDVVIPIPQFTTSKDEICAKESIMFQRTALSAEMDSLIEVMIDAPGSVIAGDTVTYSNSGKYSLKITYKRGRCSQSSEKTIIVHPIPKPDLDIDVVCSYPNKKYEVFISNSDKEDRFSLQILHEDSTMFFDNTQSTIIELMEAELYTMMYKTRSKYKCESPIIKYDFHVPSDPVLHLSYPERIGEINDFKFIISDSSEFISSREYEIEQGELILDKNGQLKEWILPGYGTFEIALKFNGMDLTCPKKESFKIVISPPFCLVFSKPTIISGPTIIGNCQPK